ncbi:MAG: chemotaxis protein CheD [Pseudomonadota bacterium]
MSFALNDQNRAPGSNRRKAIHVVQGDFAVSDDPEAMLTTVLGSCVATCLFDAEAGVGGMNHYLLPGEQNTNHNVVYGVNAMELLINGLLKLGAQRGSIKAKLFGGASMINIGSSIGDKNIEFGRRFLRDEGIECVSESLGGMRARRVQFWPTTGRARQRQLTDVADPVKVEPPAPKPAPKPATADDVEFF